MATVEQIERILAGDILKFPVYPKLVPRLREHGFIIDRHFYSDDSVILTDPKGSFACRLKSGSQNRPFSPVDARPELHVRLRPFNVKTSVGEALPESIYPAVCWAIATVFPNCHPIIKQMGLSQAPVASLR